MDAGQMGYPQGDPPIRYFVWFSTALLKLFKSGRLLKYIY